MSHPSREAAVGAVQRARDGATSLSKLTIAQRVKHLAQLRHAILARREEIVDLVQAQTGKSRSDVLVSEIFGALDAIAWAEKYAPKYLADAKVPTPLTLMGKKSRLYFEPLGVLLVISPWNYPFYQAIVPIALSLVTGNTVVYKPSEWTPLEGLVESLVEQASIAPNWVQVVYGDGKVGADLIAQGPDKIMFTGSTATGRKILAAAAENTIPVELELGGKDPMIVFDDVTVDRAVAGALWGGLTSTGQSCTSVERIYVQDGVYDRFRHALLEQVAKLKQAIDVDGDSDIGRMTTDFQVAVVAKHLADAEAKGATILTGADWDRKDAMVPPIVLENIPGDALIATEETFGPVLPLYRFSTEDEVIAKANDSVYGLTASVWSADMTRAQRVARALKAGGVSVNNVMATEATPALPFGGVKQSGFGRYKGEHGLHAFCNVKSVLVDKDSAKIESNWYPYTKDKYAMFADLIRDLFTDSPAKLARFAASGMKLESYSQKAKR